MNPQHRSADIPCYPSHSDFNDRPLVLRWICPMRMRTFLFSYSLLPLVAFVRDLYVMPTAPIGTVSQIAFREPKQKSVSPLYGSLNCKCTIFFASIIQYLCKFTAFPAFCHAFAQESINLPTRPQIFENWRHFHFSFFAELFSFSSISFFKSELPIS